MQCLLFDSSKLMRVSGNSQHETASEKSQSTSAIDKIIEEISNYEIICSKRGSDDDACFDVSNSNR